MERADLIRMIQAEYAQRQVKNRTEADARLREIEVRDPMISQLRARSAQIAMNALRQMMGPTDLERSRQIAEAMRAEGIENNRRIRERLVNMGLPEDYLEEKYVCSKCRDTGYTDDIPAKFCECFERELKLRIFEDGTMAGLDEQNFEHFSDELIERANEPEHAKVIKTARKFCLEYANAYPEHHIKNNIVLSGYSGTGKTFLLNCIFARIIERGFSGIRITAYRMHEIMRMKHIGSENGAEEFEELLNVPILFIDDLGTEPMLRGISIEYLFILLNERCAARRHTIIATNLSKDDIQDRYGERVSSRMTDERLTGFIEMKGNDLRKYQ
ncbi:MAG: ATP-binding protein [Clostridia bacterium]|nr:ATP-binding protein [Clostridia bacterium]